ncbi:MAG: PAS domain-containing protein [Chitinophagaceae bacterium]
MLEKIKRILMPALVYNRSVNSSDGLLKRKGDEIYVNLVVIISVFAFFYAFAQLYFDRIIPSVTIFSVIPLLLASYYIFFKRGHRVFAKVFSIVLILVAISILFYCSGPQTALACFILPLVVGTQMTFMGHEKRIAMYLNILTLLTIIVIVVLFKTTGLSYTVNNAQIAVERLFNFGGSLFIIYYEVTALIKTSNKIEKGFLKKEKQLIDNNVTLTELLDTNEKKNLIIGEQLSEISKSAFQLRKLSSVFGQTQSGVIITDALGCIEWANQSFERMSGWKLDEIVGKKPKAFLQKKGTEEQVNKIISEKLKNRVFVEATILNYTKQGVAFYNRLEIIPIYNAMGTLTNFISLQKDVTNEIAAQEAVITEKLRQQELLATINRLSQELAAAKLEKTV